MNVNGQPNSSAPPDPSRCGLPALKASSLDREVVDLTVELFQTDHDLELSYIEPPSIRLLEEISTVEQKAAIREFVERFKKAKHKIKKSRPGYFRGVCQKYWKQNRERKKCELLRRANMDKANDKVPRGHRGRISKLIAEAIELLFTPASGLETTIIDESIDRRLTQLSDQQGIQALYEFCSAVMYRQERIRNMNAYLMNIITRQMEKAGQTRGGNRHSANNNKPHNRDSNDHDRMEANADGHNRERHSNFHQNDPHDGNPNNGGFNNGFNDQYAANGNDGYRGNNDHRNANFDVPPNGPPDGMDHGNYGPDVPIMYGPNGWPLGPHPGYMMGNMPPHPMNAMPPHPINGFMNMAPPNGPMFPAMNGHPAQFNQFIPPQNASLPMSAYYPQMQPAASGPLYPMNGSVPSKAVAAAANASAQNSAANPFLSASSVLSPHLFPPSNMAVPGNMPPANSIGNNSLQSPFAALIPPTNSNLNMPSNPNMPTKQKHLVQELKRLVDGVSLGNSTPNESVHGGSVPTAQRRQVPELENRKTRKSNKKIAHKSLKHKSRSSSHPERLLLHTAARNSRQRSYSSSDSVHEEDSPRGNRLQSPSKSLSTSKHGRNAHGHEYSDSDHVMSSQGHSVSQSNPNGTEQDTVTADDEESGMMVDDQNNSTVATSSNAVTTDKDDTAGFLMMDDEDAHDRSHIALDEAVENALKYECAAQAVETMETPPQSGKERASPQTVPKFGAMIDDTDSEDVSDKGDADGDGDGDGDDDEEDDYFAINDTDSVGSDDLPDIEDQKLVMENQFISASDGYVIKERQEKLNAFRKNPFKTRLRKIHTRDKRGGRKKRSSHRPRGGDGHGDDVMEMIEQRRREVKEQKTKRIMTILKDLSKRGAIDQLIMSPDEKANADGQTNDTRAMAAWSRLKGGHSPQSVHAQRAKDGGDFNEREMQFLALVAKESVKDQEVSRRPALNNSKSVDHRKSDHPAPPQWGYAQPPPGFAHRSRQLAPYQGPPMGYNHGQYGQYPMHRGHGPPLPHQPHEQRPPYGYYGRRPVAPLDHVDEVAAEQMVPQSRDEASSQFKVEYREGLPTSSGPNEPISRFQDKLRLKLLRDRQHKDRCSTSETKASAERNRRRLNAKLAKMGAEDEEEMLNDQLFVETAKSLKADSIRWKQSAQKWSRGRTSRTGTPFITTDGQNAAVPPLPHRPRDVEDAEVSRRPTLQYFRSCGPPIYQHQSSRGQYSYYGHPPGFGPPHGHRRPQMLDDQPHNYHDGRGGDSRFHSPPDAHRERRDRLERDHHPAERMDDGTKRPRKERPQDDGDDSGLLTYLGAFEPSRPIHEEQNESKKPTLSLYHKSSPSDFLCPPNRHKGGGGPVPSRISARGKKGEGNAFSKAYAAHFNAVSAVTPTGRDHKVSEQRGPPGPRPLVDPHAASNPVSLEKQNQRQMVTAKIRVHHEMTLTPPDHQETTNSSGSTGSAGSDEVDSETEEFQHRQHPHQSLHDSYSYHPFSRGDDDQKKAETLSVSPSTKRRNRGTPINEEREMSSPESEVMVGVPIPVADTIDDIDEEWVCSDYDGNELDGDQSLEPNLVTPIPIKSNDRRSTRPPAHSKRDDRINQHSATAAKGLEEKSEEVAAVYTQRRSPSPPRVNYKKGNAFGTINCRKFTDTKSSALKSKKSKKSRPTPNRPTKPPLKLNKAARTSKRLDSKSSSTSHPKQTAPSPKLKDRASKPLSDTKSKLEDRASTTIDGDVATLSLSQSRTSCKAPDNEYKEESQRRNGSPKSKSSRRRNKKWQKKEQQQYAGSGLSLDSAALQNQNGYILSNASQSTPNSVPYALPYLSSVPLQGNAPSVAQLGSVPIATVPPLNHAMTAPAVRASGQNSQLKQLENTVEQLKSHFVQLLQHLPLTPSQQNTFRDQPQMMQLLSGPNPGSMSMPNAVMTSAPNVSAANLLQSNTGNIAPARSGKKGSALNYKAASFKPESSGRPTQYSFPSAASIGSYPMNATSMLVNGAVPTLSPNALLVGTSTANPMSFSTPPPMQYRHSDPSYNRMNQYPLQQQPQ